MSRVLGVKDVPTEHTDARTWNVKIFAAGEAAPTYLGNGRRVGSETEPFFMFYDAAHEHVGAGPAETGKFDELGQDWGWCTLSDVLDRQRRGVGLWFDMGQRIGVSPKVFDELVTHLPAMLRAL